MTEKPTKPRDPGDPRVSAAYKEVADERTPDHLDHVILNAARAAAKPRWNKAIAWLRPAAWVATIGVCLAIVIEISLLPEQEQVEFDSPPQAAAPAETPSPESRRLEKRLETTRPQAIGAQKLEAQKPEPVKASDLPGRADDADAAPDTRESSFEEAETRARQGAISDVESPASLLSTSPAANLAQEVATERYCDQTETADPNTWLECILELERQGLYDAARQERALLAEAFPPPELP
jgi:hypothetical protein